MPDVKKTISVLLSLDSYHIVIIELKMMLFLHLKT